jgi:hypothetical protein
MNTYKHQGWMEEPVMGRRSGPLSDGKLNEVVNFPILAAEDQHHATGRDVPCETPFPLSLRAKVLA